MVNNNKVTSINELAKNNKKLGEMLIGNIKSSDYIQMSTFASFSLVQPKKLEEMVRNIEYQLDVIKELKNDISTLNKNIQGKIKVNNVDIFYNKGHELEMFIQNEIINVYDTYDFDKLAVDIYEKAMKEREEVLNTQLKLRESEVKMLKDSIENDPALLNTNTYKQKLTKLSMDIDKIKILMLRDDNDVLKGVTV